LPVGGADVYAFVVDIWCRIERAARPEPLLRRVSPEELPRACVQRVDVAVVGAEVDVLARERNAVLDLVAGLVAPDGASRGRAERVDLPGPVADVDEPVRDERRRLGRAHPHPPAQLARVG